MSKSTPAPFYFIAPDSPVIGEHQLLIEAIVNARDKKLAMNVPPEVVKLREVSGAQEIVLALQHFPQHLPNMLNTLQFDFEVTEGSGIFMAPAVWQAKPAYARWLHDMGRLEIMPFFAKDKEAALYMIAGDYLRKKTDSIQKTVWSDGSTRFMIKGGIIRELSKRLYMTCRMFMLYCYCTGFDPKEAIISLINNFTLPVHYSDIHKHFLKDIAGYRSLGYDGQRAFRYRVA